MNPTAKPETRPIGKWGRLAGLPIFLLLAAIIAARVTGLRESHPFPTLLLVLDFTFYTLVSLGALYLIGRSFLASGSPGLLLLECGVVLWGVSWTVGKFVSHGDANIIVTVFNISIFLSGLCHLGGTILVVDPQRALRRKSMWLVAGCALALAVLWLVSQAALSGWLPVFFIPGHGGTLVRYSVLIAAIALFVLSAGTLHAKQRTARLPFTFWYALALLALAVGLFGVMIQLSLGSVVNWLSRAAQWLGGLYLLSAAVALLRESGLPLFPVEEKPHPAYYRDAVAVAVVLAAAAIRLVFLSAMGTHAPYVVFFPAVMFAAIYGGLRPGLVATALSGILAAYFWIEPVNQLAIASPSDWLSMAVFLLIGGMVAWVADSRRRARARASAAETQALLSEERVKTAEALNRQAQLLQLSHDAIIVWRMDGGIESWNRGAEALYGFSESEALGRITHELLRTIHPIPWLEIRAAMRNEGQWEGELRHFAKGGREIIVSARHQIVCGADGIERVFETNRDITVRKRAGEALRQRTLELQHLTQTLEERIKERTLELESVNKTLAGSQSRLQHLTANLLEMQEEERKRLALEVHDSFSSSLSAIKHKIEAMKGNNGPTNEQLEDLKGNVQAMISDSRRIQMELRPSILDDLGIVSALGWFMREFQKTYSQMEVTREIDVEEQEIPDRIKTPMFRMCQEAFHNAAKHSKAKSIKLSLSKKEGYLRLEIQDNGVGIGREISEFSERRGRGLGLSSMEERASLSGGVFTIHSELGKGTTIRASWILDC